MQRQQDTVFIDPFTGDHSFCEPIVVYKQSASAKEVTQKLMTEEMQVDRISKKMHMIFPCLVETL